MLFYITQNYLKQVMDMNVFNKKMKKVKPKITIVSIGTVDECECCNTEFTSGVCAYLIDKEHFINLCDLCLTKFERKEKLNKLK